MVDVIAPDELLKNILEIFPKMMLDSLTYSW